MALENQDSTKTFMGDSLILNSMGLVDDSTAIADADNFNPKQEKTEEPVGPPTQAESDTVVTPPFTQQPVDAIQQEEPKEEFNTYKFKSLLFNIRNSFTGDGQEEYYDYFNDLLVNDEKYEEYANRYKTNQDGFQTAFYDNLGKIVSQEDSTRLYTSFSEFGEGSNGLENYLYDKDKLKEPTKIPSTILSDYVYKDLEAPTIGYKAPTDELKSIYQESTKKLQDNLKTQESVEDFMESLDEIEKKYQGPFSYFVDLLINAQELELDLRRKRNQAKQDFVSSVYLDYVQQNGLADLKGEDGKISVPDDLVSIYMDNLEVTDPETYKFFKSKLDFLRGEDVDESDERVSNMFATDWANGTLSKKDIFVKYLLPVSGVSLPENIKTLDVESYLKTHYGMSDSAIKAMFDSPKDATKEGILQSFEYHLANAARYELSNAVALYLEKTGGQLQNYELNKLQGLRDGFEEDKALEEEYGERFQQFYDVVDGQYVLKSGVQSNQESVDALNELIQEYQEFSKDSRYNESVRKQINEGYDNPLYDDYLKNIDFFNAIRDTQTEIDERYPIAVQIAAQHKAINDFEIKLYTEAQKRLEEREYIRNTGADPDDDPAFDNSTWLGDVLNQAHTSTRYFIGSWVEAIANIDRSFGDGSTYDQDDFDADVLKASLRQPNYTSIPYEKPLYENRTEVRIPDDSERGYKIYYVSLDDDLEVLPEHAVYYENGLNVLDEKSLEKEDGIPISLYQQVVSKYKEDLKNGVANEPETFYNRNLTYKSVKLFGDLAMQVLITKGMSSLVSPVLRGVTAAPQLLNKAQRLKFLHPHRKLKVSFPKKIKGRKATLGKKTKGKLKVTASKDLVGGITSPLSQKTIQTISGYAGINTAISLQTHNQFYQGAIDAGLYDQTGEYTLAQTQMISLINLINPNFRFYQGHNNFITKWLLRKQTEGLSRFKARIQTSTLANNSELYRKTLMNKSGIKRLTLSQTGLNILGGSGAESFEEWLELYGEYFTNMMYNDSALDPYKFRLNELPTAQMQYESLSLGALGGAGHKIIETGGNYRNTEYLTDFEHQILVDYVNNPEEYNAIIDKNIGNYIYMPPGSNLATAGQPNSSLSDVIGQDISGLTTDGIIKLDEKSAETLKSMMTQFANEVKDNLPNGYNDTDVVAMTQLMHNQIVFQRHSENTPDGVVQRLAGQASRAYKKLINEYKNGGNPARPIKGAVTLDKNRVSPRAVVRVNGTPMLASDFIRKISKNEKGVYNDPSFVEQIINGESSIYHKYLPKASIKAVNDIIKERNKNRQQQAKVEQEAQVKAKNTPGLLFVEADEDIDSTPFGGKGRVEYSENDDLDLKDKNTNRKHIALPIGGFLEVTEVSKGAEGIDQTNRIYFRYVNQNGTKEIRVYFGATTDVDGNGKITNAKPKGLPLKVEFVQKGKKPKKVTLENKDNFKLDDNVDANDVIQDILTETLEKEGESKGTKYTHSDVPVYFDINEQITPENTFLQQLKNTLDNETIFTDKALFDLLVQGKRFYGESYQKASPNTQSLLNSLEEILENRTQPGQEQTQVGPQTQANAGTNQQTTTPGTQTQTQPQSTTAPTAPKVQNQGQPTSPKKAAAKPKPVAKQNSTTKGAKQSISQRKPIDKKLFNVRVARTLAEALSKNEAQLVRDVLLKKGKYKDFTDAQAEAEILPFLKQIGVSYKKAKEIIKDKEALDIISDAALDLMQANIQAASDAKGLDSKLRAFNIGYINGESVVRAIEASLAAGKITKPEAQRYLREVWSDFVYNSVNPRKAKVTSKVNIERLNSLLNIFDKKSADREYAVEVLKKNFEGLKKNYPLTSLKGIVGVMGDIGIDVALKKILGTSSFWTRNTVFESIKSKSEQRSIKNRIGEILKSFGIDESYINFDSSVTTSITADKNGNITRHRRDINESEFLTSFKESVNKLFDTAPKLRGKNELKGTEMLQLLVDEFRSSNSVRIRNIQPALKALGLNSLFTDSQKGTPKFFADKINEALSLEIQYSETYPKAEPLKKDGKGNWVGLQVNQDRSVDDYVAFDGKTAEVIYFNNFSGTRIGESLRIFIKKNDDGTIDEGRLQKIEDGRLIEALYISEETELDNVIKDLTKKAEEEALRMYDNLPNNAETAETVKGEFKVEDGFKVLTIHSGKYTNEFNEDGTYKYEDAGKKVLFRNLVDNDGKVYMEIKPDPKQKLNKIEFFRLLRFAYKMDAQNVAIRGASGKALLNLASRTYQRNGKTVNNQSNYIGEQVKVELSEVDSSMKPKRGAKQKVFALVDIFNEETKASFLNKRTEHQQFLTLANGFTPGAYGGFSNELRSSGIGTKGFVGGFGDVIFSSLLDANMFIDNNYTTHPQINIDAEEVLSNIQNPDLLERAKIQEVSEMLESGSEISSNIRSIVAMSLFTAMKQNNISTSEMYNQGNRNTRGFKQAEAIKLDGKALEDFAEIFDASIKQYIKTLDTERVINMIKQNELDRLQGKALTHDVADIRLLLEENMQLAKPKLFTANDVLLGDINTSMEFESLSKEGVIQRGVLLANNEINGDVNTEMQVRSMNDIMSSTRSLELFRAYVASNPKSVKIHKSRLIHEVTKETKGQNRFVDFNSKIDKSTARRLLNAIKTVKLEKPAEYKNLLRGLFDQETQKVFDSYLTLQTNNNADILESALSNQMTFSDVYNFVIKYRTGRDFHPDNNPGTWVEARFMVNQLNIAGTSVNTENGEVVTRFDTVSSDTASRNGIRENIYNTHIMKEEGGGWNPFTGQISLYGAEANSTSEIQSPLTLVHEMGHVWVRMARGKYGEKINKIFNLIETTEDPEIVKYREFVYNLYSSHFNNPNNILYYNNQRALTEEVFVQLLAHNVVEKIAGDSVKNKIIQDSYSLIKNILSVFGADFTAEDNIENMTLEGILDDITLNEFVYRDGKYNITRKANQFVRNQASKLPFNWFAKQLTYKDLSLENYVNSLDSAGQNEQYGIGLAYRNALYMFADRSDLGALSKAGLYVKLFMQDKRARLRQLEDAAKRAGYKFDDSVVDRYVLQDGKIKSKQDVIMNDIVSDNTGNRGALLERLVDDTFKNLKNPKEIQDAFTRLMYGLNGLYRNQKAYQETLDEYFRTRKDIKKDADKEKADFIKLIEEHRAKVESDDKYENVILQELSEALTYIGPNLDVYSYLNVLLDSATLDIFSNKQNIKKFINSKFKVTRQIPYWNSSSESSRKLRDSIATKQKQILDILKDKKLTQTQRESKIGEIRAEILKIAKTIPNTLIDTTIDKEYRFTGVSVAASGMSNAQIENLVKELGGKVVYDTTDGVPKVEFTKNSDGQKLMTYIEEFHDAVNRASLDAMKAEGYITQDVYTELSKNKYYAPTNVDIDRVAGDLMNVNVERPQGVDDILLSRGEQFALKTSDVLFEQVKNLDQYIFDGRLDAVNNSIVRYMQNLYRMEENSSRRIIARNLRKIQEELENDRILKLADAIKVDRFTTDGKESADIKQKVKAGRPIMGISSLYVSSEPTPPKGSAKPKLIVPYKDEGGKANYIYVYDTALAMAFVRSQNSGNGVFSRVMSNIMRSFNNFVRQAYVSRNLHFLLRNNPRDAGTTMITGAGFKPEIANKIARKTLGQLARSPFGVFYTMIGKKIDGNSLASIYNYQTGRYSDEELANNMSWAKYYELYKASGAEISWVGETNYEKFVSDMESLIKENSVKRKTLNDPLTFTNPVKIVRRMFDWLDTVNSAIENNYRLVVFRTAYEELLNDDNDLSEQEIIDKAAIASKYVTLNFEDKGMMSQYLNNYKLFFNAASQGTYMLYRYAKNPRVRKIMTGIVATGALNRSLVDYLIATTDDDEFKKQMKDIGDYEFESNFIMPIPPSLQKTFKTDKTFFAIPLPYGYNSFKYAGDIMYRNAMTKHFNENNEVYHYYVPDGMSKTKMLTTFMQSMSPIRTTGQNLEQILAPTALMSTANVYTNSNFMGNQIYLDKTAYGPAGVDAETFKSRTPDMYKKTAQTINRLTGGSTAVSGAVDSHPETYQEHINHVFGGFWGGLAESTYGGIVDLGIVRDNKKEEETNYPDNPLQKMAVQSTEFMLNPYLKKGRGNDELKYVYELQKLSDNTQLSDNDLRFYFESMNKFSTTLGSDGEPIIDEESRVNMVSQMDVNQREKLGRELVIEKAKNGELSKDYITSSTLQLQKLHEWARDNKFNIPDGVFKGKPYVDFIVKSVKDVRDTDELFNRLNRIQYNKEINRRKQGVSTPPATPIKRREGILGVISRFLDPASTEEDNK